MLRRRRMGGDGARTGHRCFCNTRERGSRPTIRGHENATGDDRPNWLRYVVCMPVRLFSISSSSTALSVTPLGGPGKGRGCPRLGYVFSLKLKEEAYETLFGLERA